MIEKIPLRKALFFIAILLLPLLAVAQELKVKSFEAAPFDLSASTTNPPRLDENKNPCALVKVALTVPGATFAGGIIGDVKRDGSDYWVYMPAGNKMLQVKHPNYESLMVYFPDYGISQLQSKVTYILRLQVPQTAPVQNVVVGGIPTFTLNGVTFSLDRAGAERGEAKAQCDLGECYMWGKGVPYNPEVAVQWYTRAADQGYATAYNNLGYAYHHGRGVQKNMEESIKYYKKAAKKGDSQGLTNLAWCYANGQGVEKDLKEAVRLCQQSIEKGHLNAMITLSHIYMGNKELGKTEEEASKLMQSAADQGSAMAMIMMGYFYYYGTCGKTKDYAEALRYFEMAAKQGEPSAWTALAECYKNGCGVEKDLQKALEYQTKAVEENSADGSAYESLAMFYSTAEEPYGDDGKAFTNFKKAEELDSEPSLLWLAECYHQGIGTQVDEEKAVSYYLKYLTTSTEPSMALLAESRLAVAYFLERGVTRNYYLAANYAKSAAEKGDREAQSILALLYMSGNGVSKDVPQALHWLTKSAENGYQAAMSLLADSYYEGKSPVRTKNYKEAVRWYAKLAELGDANAQYKLGRCYWHGNGVEQDFSLAAEWLEKAAEQDVVEAMQLFCMCLYDGKGVVQDRKAAAEWWQKAADKEYPSSMYSLGICYRYGYGVAKDVEKSNYWLKKAADKGHAEAKKLIEKDAQKNTQSAQQNTTVSTSTTTTATSNMAAGHVYVDLGLPSGTLWATCNVGASKPEEYGDYYAWGETETKSTYSWSTYRWCNGSYDTLTKYCTKSSYGTVDNKTELAPADDAATSSWGSEWCTPSIEQIKELGQSENTTSVKTTQNGVNGYKITSKRNGKSIFLPAAGYQSNGSVNDSGRSCDYWTSSLSNVGRPWLLICSDFYGMTDSYFQCNGLPVRPVRNIP